MVPAFVNSGVSSGESVSSWANPSCIVNQNERSAAASLVPMEFRYALRKHNSYPIFVACRDGLVTGRISAAGGDGHAGGGGGRIAFDFESRSNVDIVSNGKDSQAKNGLQMLISQHLSVYRST
jgi:hypothetical protein